MDAEYSEPVEEILAEEDPIPLTPMHYISLVWQVFEEYGWFILGFSLLIAFAYRKLQPYINNYQKKCAEYEYAQRYHKDPDMVEERLAKQAEVIRRKQEQYQKDAEEYQKKQEEKEQKKREERIMKLEGNSVGTKLGSTEYNPLMGDSSSKNYKPTRKSPCGGGGCGR